jgi:DNA-binding protein HU-beta
VKVAKTSVPAFRPGQAFKDVVTGARSLPTLQAERAGSRTGTRTKASSRA